MRCIASFLLLLSAGCSTAPVADVLDFAKPGRIKPGAVPAYGGVCGPHCPSALPPSPIRIVPVPDSPAFELPR